MEQATPAQTVRCIGFLSCAHEAKIALLLPSRRVSNPSLPFTSLQVGNQFVSQYYTVLHSSPKHLHRFYSDRSTLTYADVIPEGDSITQNLKTATGQKVRMLCCTCIETGGPACIIF
jgi:hypothetical protein